jgi:hypothetical protein
MTSKLPDNVNVMGTLFKIVQGTLIDEEGNGSYGEWDGTDLSIHLEITSPRPHKAITLLHELIHGIDELCFMRLSHQNVYILSQVLYQIILQNPELIEYISNSYSEDREGQGDGRSAGHAHQGEHGKDGCNS